MRLNVMIELLEYVKSSMQLSKEKRGYAFILHLKLTREEIYSNHLTIELLEEMHPNLLVLCGLMPFHEAFKHCTMMINHGGTGTIQKAASYGVPQLCVPINCSD